MFYQFNQEPFSVPFPKQGLQNEPEKLLFCTKVGKRLHLDISHRKFDLLIYYCYN